MIIPFGEWLPDEPTNVSCRTAHNCVSYGSGYKSLPTMTVVTGSGLTNTCLGAIAVTDAERYPYIYAGDSSKLYSITGISGTTPSDKSRSTGYSTATHDFWSFAKYGNKVIATNYHDLPQYIEIGGSVFADLTNAPKARHVATVRDFLVFGDLFEGSGTISNRLRWSAKGDETDYTASVTTQSDSVDLVGDSGPIMKIIGGEYGVVFQQKQIWRMTYVGGSAIFQLDPVEQGRGAMVSNSVVKVGSMVFFLDSDGFYMFNGGGSVPIGDGKVDRWFFADLDTSYRHKIVGAADPKNKLVFWLYPDDNATSGAPNSIIIYNWATGRWTSGDLAAGYIFPALYTGYTLEDIDSVNGSIDALTESLDSYYWKGEGAVLGVFDNDNNYNTLDAIAAAATLETPEVELTPYRKTTVSRARVLGTSGTFSLSVGERNLMTASVSYTNGISQNTTGLFRPRTTARYQSFKVTTTNTFTDLVGVDVEPIPRGKR